MKTSMEFALQLSIRKENAGKLLKYDIYCKINYLIFVPTALIFMSPC